MPPFLHLQTLHLAAAISAAVVALLLLTHRRTLTEMRVCCWIMCFTAMSLSFAAFSMRGRVPDWVPILVGNIMGWLSMGLIWHCWRELRGAPSRAWLVPVPSLAWAALCLVPAFYEHEATRIATSGAFGILLVAGGAVEAWITWRATRLSSMRDVALILTLCIPYFIARGIAGMLGLAWLAHMMSGWIGLVTATALPFLMLSVMRENATELQRERESAALRDGRDQIDRLLTNLPAVVLMREFKPDGSIRLLYRGGDVEAVTGWPRATTDRLDDISKLAVDLTDQDRADAYQRALTGDVVSLEYQIRLPDGGTKWLRFSGRIVERRPDGSALGVGHVIDIQDLRNAEARATSAARLSSLGEMAAGLAHELRQPLAIVSMAAENAADDIAAGDTQSAQARLHRIIGQNERASNIIDNLRRFAMGAQERGEAEPVPLQEAVERSLMLMRGVLHQGGVEVEQTITSPAPVALAWPGAIEQVLVNLLSNANHALATRPLGTRRVRIEVACCPTMQTVRLVVADTGGGVAPDILPRLFQPFVTSRTAHGGTGLGLALCQGMVSALGGTIGVENRGEGAVFTVILPAAMRPGLDNADLAA